MCYRLIEIYSVCGCQYYRHAADLCASYNRPGHRIEERIIRVGYACLEHTTYKPSKPDPKPSNDGGYAPQAATAVPESHESDSGSEDSVFSDTGSALSTTSSAATTIHGNAVEAVFHGLLQHPQLVHLWPQVVRRTRFRARSLRTLERFLRRYGEDLQALAAGPAADDVNNISINSNTVRGPSLSTPQVCVDVSRFVSRIRFNLARRIFEAHSETSALAEDRRGVSEKLYMSVDAGEEYEDDGDEDANPFEFTSTVAETFLFETEPIQSLENNVRVFVQAPSRPKGWSTVWKESVQVWLENTLDSIYQPAVAESQTRITWTCKCGRKLYDDFTELQPGAAKKLEVQLRLAYSRQDKESILPEEGGEDGCLQQRPISQRQFQSNSKTIQVPWKGTNNPSALSWPWRGPGGSVRATTTTTGGTGGTGGQSLPQYTGQNQTTAGRDKPRRDKADDLELGRCPNRGPSLDQTSNRNNIHRHLLLCVPFMRWATALTQPEVCRVHSDRDMFHIMRHCYHASREEGGRYWRRLRRVQGIHFVMFELYSSQLVDVRQHPSVPPHSPTAPSTDIEYAYEPVPVDVLPPVGSNHLMHLFEHPDHAEVLPVLFRKIPKRLRGRLVATPTTVGWGLSFVEGKNWLALFVYGCVGFAVALLVAVVWAVVCNDVQGGFAIAGYMISLLVFCGSVASVEIRL